MKKALFVFIHIIYGLHLQAQHTNIMISNAREPNEPSIMINPRNTLQMLAGANLNNYYYSCDGGLSWYADTLSSSYGVWGDPTLVVDTAGSFYFFHLSNPDAGNWIDRIVCQRMDSIGHVWTDGSYAGLNGSKAQDKQWAVVDPATNVIYISWTQFDEYGSSNPGDSSVILFSKSADRGESWIPVLRINHQAGDCIDEDNTVEGAVPALGPNGELYVAWTGPEGIVFNTSADGGSTWLPAERHVSDVPGGWDYIIPGLNRCNGLPVTCCDVSNGPHRGNIYINWTDQRNGSNDTDVWMIKSADGGNTWSDVKCVNDDGPGRHQFLSWMCVDQVTGYVYFVFYDRRNYSSNQTDVYLAVSKDGGEHFINYRISETPFTPVSAVFFGDYTNISAHNNVIRPIWGRCDSGPTSIWTAIIDTTILGVAPAEINELQLEQNSPNPFSETTWFSFKLRRPGKVSLKVLDVFGREVAVIMENEYLAAGKYIRQFDVAQYGIASGVYYFSLISNEKTLSRKMVVQ